MSKFLDSALFCVETLWRHFIKVILYPVDPNQRIFVLYLFTSLLFSMVVFIKAGAGKGDKRKKSPSEFFKFLFPETVWSNPSAWLDVRYFFFHQVFRILIYGAFMSASTVMATDLCRKFWLLVRPADPASVSALDWKGSLVFTLVYAVIADFVSYCIHYAQHRIPVLWEFHKVHHSATVMHPLTNYREHPVDNIVYAIGQGVSVGAIMGTAMAFLGYAPSVSTIYGVMTYMFLYNLLGYNLRHSHVWLKWPGILVYIFGCPAHHQVHHSYYPEHINKNFAFMFPIWDVLFGTFCVPESNKDIKLGLDGREEYGYKSCLGLYFLPFKKCFTSRLTPSEEKVVEQ